jgi:hypothetical protein
MHGANLFITLDPTFRAILVHPAVRARIDRPVMIALVIIAIQRKQHNSIVAIVIGVLRFFFLRFFFLRLFLLRLFLLWFFLLWFFLLIVVDQIFHD